MMDAAPAQLVGLAVDPQSIDGVDLDLSDAERSGHPIDSLATRDQQAFDLVQGWAVRGPEAGPGDLELRRSINRTDAFRDGFASCVANAGFDRTTRRGV